MTLAATGAISLGGSTATRSVALELGRSATAAINMNDAALRTLAGKASGAISLGDFRGKSNFTPQTIVRQGSASSQTVPAGATNVIIEAWGNGGYGGGYYFDGSNYNSGGGGGAGGYCRSSYSCSGGQTINYDARAGFTVQVTSGTLSITTMTANNGGNGVPGTFSDAGFAGNGGTATGGNQANVTGQAGSGAAPGNSTAGVYGGPFGDGGSGDASPASTPGGPGGIVFRFT